MELDAFDRQIRINNEVWSRGEYLQWYATRALRPVEIILLLRYREALAGRVLELGCGAGRITGYILELGGDVLGLDLAPKMVEYCRATFPEGAFQVGDLRELDRFAVASFDAVVAGNNIIDVLDDAGRRRVILEVGRMLAPGGIFIMSSHNRAHGALGMFANLRGNGKTEALRRLFRIPRWIATRRRLRSFEIDEREYAVVNDEAHDYRLLHYHVTRDAQERQLSELGFELVECLDEGGKVVPPGGTAAHDGDLHYVTRLWGT